MKKPAPAGARAGEGGDCGDHCRTGAGASKTGVDLASDSRLAYTDTAINPCRRCCFGCTGMFEAGQSS